MPGLQGRGSRSRESEVVAALAELRESNLRGNGGVSDATWREVVEDYFCVRNDDSDSDSDEMSILDDSYEIESEEDADDLRDAPLACGRVEPEPAKTCKDKDAILRFECACRCKEHFSIEQLLHYRFTMLELGRNEKDLVVMAQLHAFNNSDEITSCSKRKSQKERERGRCTYSFRGHQVCRAFFKMCHIISTNKLTSLKKWVEEFGVCPVVSKSGGRRFNLSSLSPDELKAAVNFILNYAEDNAVFLPGRVPGYTRSDVRLLPSSHPKVDVWRQYKSAMDDAGQRAMGQSTFLKVWRKYQPNILVCKPMSDLCWQCQRNNSLLYRSANLPEAEKERRVGEQLVHLRNAKRQREVLQEMVSSSKRALLDEKLGSNAACSRDITAHYSFDYAQQIHFPACPQQPGPIYFLTPRKCGIFGINCEGASQQVNFLVDEGMCVSKGSVSVISFLHYFFGSYGLGEKDAQLHCDNCSGQNKNRYLLWYLAWRVMEGLHQTISLNFLLAGHTKFSPDFCFGLLKRSIKKSSISTLADIAAAVERSAANNMNIAQLVGDEGGAQFVPTYKWQEFLAPFFRPLPNIKKYHHFRLTADEPGVVYAKMLADSPEERFCLLKDPTILPSGLPDIEPPPGLSRERQAYLFDKIREFCRPDARNITCPRPR